MHYLTLDELRNLLAHTQDERWRAAILVSAWHGLRVSETLALTPANFINGGLDLQIQRLKGSNKTLHPLIAHPDPTLDEVAALHRILARHRISHAPRNERLFPWTRDGFLKLIKRVGTKAGISAQKLHPHALKHTCAKLGLAGGMQINELQAYLGHKSGASTLMYLRVDDQQASSSFCAAVGKRL